MFTRDKCMVSCAAQIVPGQTIMQVLSLRAFPNVGGHA
jgi:hypothetical protein